MPGYWWHCESCDSDFTFPEARASSSIVAFIWDDLVTHRWDQTLLNRICPKCSKQTVALRYEFPRRKEPESLKVVHIVGITPPDGSYLPMVWETAPLRDPEQRWFDFKYMNGRSNWGLNKAAALDKSELRRLFALYEEVTGHPLLS
jgi:hypothetical protein